MYMYVYVCICMYIEQLIFNHIYYIKIFFFKKDLKTLELYINSLCPCLILSSLFLF